MLFESFLFSGRSEENRLLIKNHLCDGPTCCQSDHNGHQIRDQERAVAYYFEGDSAQNQALVVNLLNVEREFADA